MSVSEGGKPKVDAVFTPEQVSNYSTSAQRVAEVASCLSGL